MSVKVEKTTVVTIPKRHSYYLVTVLILSKLTNQYLL